MNIQQGKRSILLAERTGRSDAALGLLSYSVRAALFHAGREDVHPLGAGTTRRPVTGGIQGNTGITAGFAVRAAMPAT